MSFFSDAPPEEILGDLALLLEKTGIQYRISDKSWKLCYDHVKTLQPFALEQDDGIQELKEETTVQVEILDAGDGKICVEFSRLTGSSSLFYD